MLLRHPSYLLPGLFALSIAAFAQDQPPAAAPAPAAQPTAAAVTPPDPKAKPAVPDYPDPRTFTAGIFYWFTVPGAGPDIRGGKLATGFETLYGLGKAHQSPGVEFTMPVTRTGSLHLEVFRNVGSGNQTAPVNTTVFATDFTKGDSLATSYRTDSAKLYLDDLLWPHKFPVSRFRVKSLWGVQYIGFKGSVDATNSTTALGTGSRTVILPSFGLAAEYALAPHILFRAAGSGFGLPHRSNTWDGEATISVRQKKIEFVGGVKAFHFKSTPNKEEYITQELYGGFVGLRYHFGS